MPRLTTEKKAMIVERARGDVTQEEIANDFGVAVSTVSRLIKGFKERGTVESKKSSGRPKSLTDKDRRFLRRYVKKNRSATQSSIISDMPFKMSTWLLRHELKQMNIRKRMRTKKPYLEKRHMRERLKFAREHKNWTLEQWRKVIWTDESSIEIGADIDLKKVWREPKEKFLRDCLKPSFMSGRTKVMVWGAIRGNEKSKLVILPKGRIRSKEYVDYVCKPVLLDFYNSKPDATLMEDNAPIHRSRKTNEWREAAGIRKLKWPSRSPDLNPIENIWNKLKREFHREWYNHRSRRTTQLMLRYAWSSISIEYVNRLINSMPSRMQQVIDAKGGSIKY